MRYYRKDFKRMEYIAHRINKLKELEQLNGQYGVEIDLRDNLTGRIYIEHDPFIDGEDFEEYLKAYRNGIMILNVKSERIELLIDKLLKKYKINNYFYLDSTFPMIKLLVDKGEKNIALRFSEYEGLDTIENMREKVNWIWVDCFSKFPLTKEIETKMHNWGYQICLVSPELQGQAEKLEIYAEQILEQNIEIDAICTKLCNIAIWEKRLNKENCNVNGEWV